jgi:hypothetical protein
MEKNVAGQVVAFQMVSAADGSDVTTGTPTVYVTGDGGTQSTGTGAAAHEGNGCWSYAPTQAETNFDHAAFTMVLATAITQTVNVYTRPENFGALQIPADGRAQVDVREINGADTDGNNAVLSLKGLNIQADDGTIPVYVSAGATCGEEAVVIQSLRDGFDTMVVQKAGGSVTGRALAIIGAYQNTVEIVNGVGYDAVALDAVGAGRALALDGGIVGMRITGDRAVQLVGKATSSHGHAVDIVAGDIASAAAVKITGPATAAGNAVEVSSATGSALDLESDTAAPVVYIHDDEAGAKGVHINVPNSSSIGVDVDSHGPALDLDSSNDNAVDVASGSGSAVKLAGTVNALELAGGSQSAVWIQGAGGASNAAVHVQSPDKPAVYLEGWQGLHVKSIGATTGSDHFAVLLEAGEVGSALRVNGPTVLGSGMAIWAGVGGAGVALYGADASGALSGGPALAAYGGEAYGSGMGGNGWETWGGDSDSGEGGTGHRARGGSSDTGQGGLGGHWLGGDLYTSGTPGVGGKFEGDTTAADLVADEIANLVSRLGIPGNLGGGASVGDNLADMAGSGFNTATDSLEEIRDAVDVAGKVVRYGTAQAGASINTIVLDSGASSTDGAYDPAAIAILDGTGAGQCRLILEYTGATRTAVVDRNWKVTPDATSVFAIFADPGREHVNEGLAQAGAASTVTLNALASSADGAYVGQIIFIRSGVGEDQARVCTAYNGTTKVATVDAAWDTTPDATSAYVVLPDGLSDIRSVSGTAVANPTALVKPGADAALNEAIAEPSAGAPATTASVRLILSWVWMGLRNKGITDSGTNLKKWHNAAGVLLAKKPVDDNGTIYTEDEMVAP